MQVLYVGNGNYKHRGAFYYDVGRKLCNGLTRLGHNVYFLSDRDTARAATFLHTRRLGVGRCNRIFLETCRNLQPDMILLGHADIVANASLEEARTIVPKVKMAQFNVDAVFNPHTREQIATRAAHCDATFITTAGDVLKQFSRAGGVVAYMPNPVDGSIEWPKCFERSDQDHDVFWALRAVHGSYPGDPRVELPLYLERSGKVAIDYHGMNGRPGVFDARYFRSIANARMGLNISNTCHRGNTTPASPEALYLYSSDRIAHYMGSGLQVFTPRSYRLDELFIEDSEMIFFSTAEELLDKVLYYKAHDDERRQVARAGWETMHRCYNERIVAQYLIEHTFRLNLSESYAWPTQTY